MDSVVIRPTLKWVRFGYTCWFLLAFIAIFVRNNYYKDFPLWPVFSVIAALWIVWPLRLQIRRRFTKLIIEADKLRFETGVISKTTRTLQLTKIQDVTVTQSLIQRLTGTGDLLIETAGETGRLMMHDLDQPQAVADQIMDWAREQPKRKGERS